MVQTTLIIKNEKIVNKWGFLLKKYKGDSERLYINIIMQHTCTKHSCEERKILFV